MQWSGAKLAGAEINIMVSVFLLAALAAGYGMVQKRRQESATLHRYVELRLHSSGGIRGQAGGYLWIPNYSILIPTKKAPDG